MKGKGCFPLFILFPSSILLLVNPGPLGENTRDFVLPLFLN